MASFYLITGFLGSGKTTLLKNILYEIGNKKKIAIIQNEFASTGIDGKELKLINDQFKLVEINNGSVFCVCQLGNFIDTIHQILENYQPEIIFLETSGLADPISISELLMHSSFKGKIRLEKIITVVDSRNFERGLQLMPRFRHQLMVADTILMNKAELAKQSLTGIHKKVLEIAPFGSIIHTDFCQLSLNKLFNLPASELNHLQFNGHESAGRPSEVQTLVLRTGDQLSHQGLLDFVGFLKRNSLRSKGFVNLSDGRKVIFHTVFDDEDITEIKGYMGLTEIIVFTSNLQLAELRQQFKSRSD
ncbi:MAG: GTP-binding protein [Prolixibacteraceae bacterium]